VKRVLVILEGAAGEPQPELEGATPLEVARGVNTSALATRGATGWLDWASLDLSGRTEEALAVLLGVPPAEARALRRGAVEAAAAVPPFAPWIYAFSGQFVTVDGDEVRDDRADGLSLDETRWLVDGLRTLPALTGTQWAVAASGRVLVALDSLSDAVDSGVPPVTGRSWSPAEPGDRTRLMRAAAAWLPGQTVNTVRLDLGENPANVLWLWGGGAPATISRAFIGAPVKAVMVTDSPLARGLAALARMPVQPLGGLWEATANPPVRDADGYAALLEKHELVIVYVEAPDGRGGYGAPVEKAKALDRIDLQVVARVAAATQRFPEHRIMVAALPAEGEAHPHTPVLLAGHRIDADPTVRWDETACTEGTLGSVAAHRAVSRVLD
jgi:2,3-bisphosphoglycerate-independent phosphoglycerate mutase